MADLIAMPLHPLANGKAGGSRTIAPASNQAWQRLQEAEYEGRLLT
ncbi:MAG: hypothetical protein WEB00_01560 [Dehalococcoidia bacterium]